jgi:hypothetical protein
MDNPLRPSPLSHRVALGVALAVGSPLFANVTYAQAQTTIYACVHSDGDRDDDAEDGRLVRIVDAAEACKRRETRIHWNVTGPQGPAGPAGPMGPVGPRGANGPTGLTGPAGGIGPGGPMGPAGGTGPAGPTGPAGGIGPIGPIGPQGAIGPQGPAGATGAQGAKGDTGPAGSQGPIGPAGAKGDKGDTGATGPAGAAGPQGIQGVQGPTGLQGPQGPMGPQGPAGSILVGAQNWSPNSNLPLANNQAFQNINGSGFPGTTLGAPLLIQISVPVFVNGGNVACQPAVDSKWVGFYSFPSINPADPMKDMFVATNGYYTLSSSHIYANVPPGNHWFTVQCWAAGTVWYPTVNTLVSMSVVELR